MPSEGKPKPPSKLAGGKFAVEKKLGAGCFGEVYMGRNTQTNGAVAIKTEDVQSTAPQLESEADTLNILRQPVQPQGFAELFYFGREGDFNVMVMEILGKSVEDQVQKCGGKFNAKTAVLVALQMLVRIEYLHSKGIIHRDIKPENFMFGVEQKIHHIYLIDFGLSKRYWDKKHSPMRQKLSLTGTARYASINAHKGFEQSRRDDLEAIFHMHMYFLRGSLPWSGLDAKTKQEKYKKIMEKKEQVPLEELCAGHPTAFQELLAYARNLEFMQRPDYNMMREKLTACRASLGNPEDHQYEWFDNKPPQGTLVPLQPPPVIHQPDDPIETKPGGGKKKGGFFCCGGNSKVND